MSEIAKHVGNRIRSYRTQLGYSQERLAEISGCHPTYIGQVERGEKNPTLESVEKIATINESNTLEIITLFSTGPCLNNSSTPRKEKSVGTR